MSCTPSPLYAIPSNCALPASEFEAELRPSKDVISILDQYCGLEHAQIYFYVAHPFSAAIRVLRDLLLGTI
jgi:hypothetical protein